MIGIVVGLGVVVFGSIFAVITRNNRHRQHEENLRRLVEQQARLADGGTAGAPSAGPVPEAGVPSEPEKD